MSYPWTVASDEDVTIGYLLVEPGLPSDPDALLGLFVVLARREWGALYDPNHLLLGARPARYRMTADGEQMVPAGKRKADSRWWVITGLDDAQTVPASHGSGPFDGEPGKGETR